MENCLQAQYFLYAVELSKDCFLIQYEHVIMTIIS